MDKRKTTKVRVCFNVTIDVEAYRTAYGTETVRDIQNDARQSLYSTAVQATFSHSEGIIVDSNLENRAQVQWHNRR